MTYFRCVVTALTMIGLWVESAAAQNTHRVATSAELQQVLTLPPVGLEIVLAPGKYGDLSLRGLSGAKNAPLVIRSEDPSNPASFSSMTLRDMKYVVFDKVTFDYAFQADDPISLRPFQILSSEGIIIRDAIFDGDLAQSAGPIDTGFGTGIGLSVVDTLKMMLLRSEVFDFHRGMVFSRSRDIVLRDNDIHNVRSDGMNFAQVERILIEDNHIHDFAKSSKSKDHADMIQFWTNGTNSPSREVIIRNNVLNSGKGGFTQSIFMRNDMVDRGLAGGDMFYRNVVIEENVIINAHLHGITIGETDGLRITNNSVLRNSGSEGEIDNPSLWTPKISVAKTSRNVEIKRNVTSRIDGGTSLTSWDIRDNVFVQDRARMKPGFYGLVFVDEVIRDPSRLQSFAPRAGGPLDREGIGARRLRISP